MTDTNPYKSPAVVEVERDRRGPVGSTTEPPTQPVRVWTRAIVVFLIAWCLVSVVLIVLFGGGFPASSLMGVLLPIACFLIAILLTAVDTIQYKRFLQKRNM